MAQADSVGAKEGRWSLQGVTALVTGGTKGIWYAVVEDLARIGARVHTCSRKEAQLNGCLQEWDLKKLRVSGSVCDLVFPADRKELIDEVSSLFNGKLNILINNVGTNIRKSTLRVHGRRFLIYDENKY